MPSPLTVRPGHSPLYRVPALSYRYRLHRPAHLPDGCKRGTYNCVQGNLAHSDRTRVRNIRRSRPCRRRAASAQIGQWGCYLAKQFGGQTSATVAEPERAAANRQMCSGATEPYLRGPGRSGRGHGLASAGLASLLVGAYRHARRGGLELPRIAEAIDAAVRRCRPSGRCSRPRCSPIAPRSPMVPCRPERYVRDDVSLA